VELQIPSTTRPRFRATRNGRGITHKVRRKAKRERSFSLGFLRFLESLKGLGRLLGHVWIATVCGLAEMFGRSRQIALRS